MKGGVATATAAAIVLALLDGARAFTCSVQDSKDEDDWTQGECTTFCLIAFGESTLYPSFKRDGPICQAAGCAVLDGEGAAILGASVAGGEDWPMDGEIVVYRCDNGTFLSNPVSLEAVPGESCNLYRTPTGDQQCQTLTTGKVGTLFRDAPFLEKNRFQITVGSLSVLFLVILVGAFVWYRARHPAQSPYLSDGLVLEVPLSKLDQKALNDEFPDDDDPADAASDMEDPLAAQGRGQGSGSVRSDSLFTDGDTTAGEIPAKYAPGSAVYERYHAALCDIYREAGQDVSKVDGVLHQYLSREDGIALLNKKLKIKFNKKVAAPRKKQQLFNYANAPPSSP